MKLERFEYTTNAQKTTDFILGFVGWFLGNVMLWGLATALQFGILALMGAGNVPSSSDSLPVQIIGSLGLLCGLLQFLINIGALVYFGFTRQWVALGILTAFGASFTIALCAGIIFSVLCFGSLSRL